MWGDIAIAFLLAFITAFVLTPFTMRLAKKVGAIDIPNDRRVNKNTGMCSSSPIESLTSLNNILSNK